MELYDYELQHIETLRRLAPECMVLLQSDGTFPIAESCDVALYGNGARNTLKGGTGSGDVNVRHFTTIEEGLENAGFIITTKSWLDAYDEVHKEARVKFVQGIKDKAKEQNVPAITLGLGVVMPEPEYELPLKTAGQLAIYVLGRESGEGADRKAEAGDLKLTNTEIRDILELQKSYEKFLLVLNVGGVVDLTPAMEVKNILLVSQTGMTIGDSFTDVLLGKSYPSGKLASTWAAWEDYCEIGEFAEEDDTRYNEGVYVGYRYFDTVGKKPLFPFGYGLGYTTFTVENAKVTVQGMKVQTTVSVTNNGSNVGKEVVQLYVSVPSDELDQPYQTLAAFQKTGELMSDATESVNMTFDLSELASFDTEKGARILEAGDYVLRVGTSSRDTTICGVIHLDETVVIERVNHVGGEADFEDWKPNAIPYSYVGQEELENATIYRIASDAFHNQTKNQKSNESDFKEIEKELSELSNEELAYLCLGGFVEEGSQSVIGAAATKVAGAAGETTSQLYEKGIPALVMADGPAGLRLSRQYGLDEKGIYSMGDSVPAAMLEFIDEALLAVLSTNPSTKKDETPRGGEIFEQYCSAIPVGTALAQSWNEDLCVICGDLVGAEMERFGVHLWLAPALNIHRSPLCGRNFEYYSEDPLISGKMAAGITKGVQSHSGCGVTVKHFVCNNQETNRFRSNSIVSERALRDIYLRGFEIVIKESAPAALMTSYNLLNGEHTSQRRDLNVTVLREEWGYEGMVMSDWVTTGFGGETKKKYPYACASGSVKGGNDIFMPGTILDHKDILEALNSDEAEYPLTRENLLECAAHVVSSVRKSTKVFHRMERN